MAARKFVSLSVTMTGVLRTKFLCLLGVLFTKLFFPLLCARWLFYLTIIFASLFRRAWWVFYFRNCVSRSLSMVVLLLTKFSLSRSVSGFVTFALCASLSLFVNWVFYFRIFMNVCHVGPSLSFCISWVFFLRNNVSFFLFLTYEPYTY